MTVDLPPEPAPASSPGPRRRLRRLLAISLALALLACLVWRPVLRALPRLLVERAPPCRADAIVVLAGDSEGRRVDRAVALFEAGHLPRGPLVLAGGRLYAETTWAALMRKRALARGVPAERIVVQDRSTTTLEDVRACLPLLQRPEGEAPPVVLLVTSAWHSGRAARLFRREAGDRLRIVSCPVADPPAEWWTDAAATRALATELLKWAWPGPGS